ncbi:MAG: hypothetical protein ALECFALPRED_009121 [Alectoria fallacina]|uniref:Uncharacterized protein n=1 Tax=Alectoria fallacina TaxID=1903189 RepID=A0A8H3F3W2_9LECA|nr:MAG: hypothetical protein ALECFALPRED_009121 [Alectoria fallacina]
MKYFRCIDRLEAPTLTMKSIGWKYGPLNWYHYENRVGSSMTKPSSYISVLFKTFAPFPHTIRPNADVDELASFDGNPITQNQNTIFSL